MAGFIEQRSLIRSANVNLFENFLTQCGPITPLFVTVWVLSTMFAYRIRGRLICFKESAGIHIRQIQPSLTGKHQFCSGRSNTFLTNIVILFL
jgi:hypothetical protein